MKTVKFEGTLEEWTSLVQEMFPECFIESNGKHRYAMTHELDLAHYSIVFGGGWIKVKE